MAYGNLPQLPYGNLPLWAYGNLPQLANGTSLATAPKRLED